MPVHTWPPDSHLVGMLNVECFNTSSVHLFLPFLAILASVISSSQENLSKTAFFLTERTTHQKPTCHPRSTTPNKWRDEMFYVHVEGLTSFMS